MNADWKKLSRAAGLEVEQERLRVQLGARTQVVKVMPDAKGFTLRSRVAPRRRVDGMTGITDRIGDQNRMSELIGYRIDGRGRLIGESWVPAEGLDAAEWEFYVRRLAEACDRLEFVLTGLDQA